MQVPSIFPNVVGSPSVVIATIRSLALAAKNIYTALILLSIHDYGTPSRSYPFPLSESLGVFGCVPKTGGNAATDIAWAVSQRR